MTGQHDAPSWADRFERWLVLTLVWQHGQPREPGRPVREGPVRTPRHRITVRAAGALIGVILPGGVAGALIPLRDDLAASSTVLVLVLPVVLVALIAGAWPGIVASISAALAFDVFLTRPYYSVTVDAAADVEAAAVLCITALTVAALVARELTARRRSALRHTALTEVRSVARAAVQGVPEDLVDTVTEAVRSVLRLRSCRWAPGYHGTAGTVLARDGSFGDGDLEQLTILPSDVELPVRFRNQELGRLVLTGDPRQVVSLEERTVAVALADILAVSLGGDRS